MKLMQAWSRWSSVIESEFGPTALQAGWEHLKTAPVPQITACALAWNHGWTSMTKGSGLQPSIGSMIARSPAISSDSFSHGFQQQCVAAEVRFSASGRVPNTQIPP
jgi:hypothetical protein